MPGRQVVVLTDETQSWDELPGLLATCVANRVKTWDGVDDDWCREPPSGLLPRESARNSRGAPTDPLASLRSVTRGTRPAELSSPDLRTVHPAPESRI